MKFLMIALAVLALAACDMRPPADVASYNVSQAADNFEVTRRVVFFNGITDTYLLSIEGLCSLGNYDTSSFLSVTCQVGDGKFKKHYLGLSDNVSYFVEHMDPTPVSTYHYRVMFRPQTIIPDVDFQGDVRELTTDTN